jgi:hypothetical protein
MLSLYKGVSKSAAKRALDELLGMGAPVSISWTQVNEAVNLWAEQFAGERIRLITIPQKDGAGEGCSVEQFWQAIVRPCQELEGSLAKFGLKGLPLRSD